MRLSTYFELLRDLARRHKLIAATPENGRFMRLMLSVDPVARQFDLTEFDKKLRTGLKSRPGEPFLVAQNYEVEYVDNHGDAQQRLVHGAYLVLEPTKVDDYDGRDAAISRCEAIAEQLLGAVVSKLYDDHAAQYVDVSEAWLEHVGPLASLYFGVRLNFSWREPATLDLAFNPDAFHD